MKPNKSKYLSFFFLISFLASFGTSSFQNFHVTYSKQKFDATKHILVSSKDENSSGNNDFLFEENENEVEDDFEAQFFLLPFFLAQFQLEIVPFKFIFSNALTEKAPRLIYISVCNFRI